VIRPAGLDGRCEIVGGSYWDGVPAGGDAYIIKSVLMDKTDEEVATLLRNVRSASTPSGSRQSANCMRSHDPAVAADAGRPGHRMMDRRRFLPTVLTSAGAAALGARTEQAAKGQKMACLFAAPWRVTERSA
jgi:O-methyltransferase domain